MATVYRHEDSKTGVVVSSLDEHFVMLWGESELKKKHDLEAAVLILKEEGVKAFTRDELQVSDAGKDTENLVLTSYWGAYYNMDPGPGDLIAIGDPRQVDKLRYDGIRIVRCTYTLEDRGIRLKDWKFKPIVQVKQEIRAHNEFWYRQWWDIKKIVNKLLSRRRLILK